MKSHSQTRERNAVRININGSDEPTPSTSGAAQRDFRHVPRRKDMPWRD